MRLRSFFALAALCLGGCAAAAKDQVLFVTSTSWGAQFAQTPPTASIAYDRAEGYYGPSYANGALPPIAAVFGSGGNIFAPQVRQLYTTGAAALLATNATGAEPGPSQLLSASDADKHIMFFGTGTTVGLKVGFGTSGAPDSLNFGYRRLEFSLIHLGRQIVAGGALVDVYPSVLASIDTTSNATSAADTGLHVQQFFATGQAADALAQSGEVQNIIRGMANGSLTATLTDEQALAAGKADASTINNQLASIQSCVSPGGAFSAAKWKALLATARGKGGRLPVLLDGLGTWESIVAHINTEKNITGAIYDALPSPPTSC
jgi:hypothetical protein